MCEIKEHYNYFRFCFFNIKSKDVKGDIRPSKDDVEEQRKMFKVSEDMIREKEKPAGNVYIIFNYNGGEDYEVLRCMLKEYLKERRTYCIDVLSVDKFFLGIKEGELIRDFHYVEE